MAHTCSPSIQEAKAGRSEFKASLVYMTEFQDDQRYMRKPVS